MEIPIRQEVDVASNVYIRLMTIDDLFRGFLDCLNELRPTLLTPESAIPIFEERSRQPWLLTLVGVTLEDRSRVVGTATVITERKYLHAGANAARIEEVAVLKSYQKQGLGKRLVQSCVEIARNQGCYKVSLCASDELVGFYSSLGFTAIDNNMRMDLAASKYLPSLN